MADETIEVRGKLGKVSFGKGAASVRINIERDEIGLADADQQLTRARIEANLELDQDAEDQQVIEGLAPEVRGSADTTTLRIDSDHIGVTLGFNGKSLGDDGSTALRKLSQSPVRLRFVRTGDAKQSETGDGHAEGQTVGGDEPSGPSMFDDEQSEPDPEAWRREPVTSLKAHGVKQGTVDALAQHDITTLGELSERISRGQGWHQDMKGIGPQAVESLEAAMPKWFAANPEKCPPQTTAA